MHPRYPLNALFFSPLPIRDFPCIRGRKWVWVYFHVSEFYVSANFVPTSWYCHLYSVICTLYSILRTPCTPLFVLPEDVDVSSLRTRACHRG